MSTTVLIYGADPILLETRSLLLSRQGFRVIVSKDLKHIEASIREFAPSIAVFCSSLTAEQQENGIALAHRLDPAIKNIVVETLTVSAISEQADSLVNGLQGPKAFIDAVEELAIHPASYHASKQTLTPTFNSNAT